MAYSRKRKGFGRPYKKRKVTLRKVVKQVKTLKKYAKAEVRYVDNTFALAGVSTTATLTFINGVAQGDDSNNREGNATFNKMVTIKGRVNPNTSTTLQHVRLIVLYDKQSNGAAPAIADILEQSTNVDSMRFWNSRARYRFLVDKTFSVGPQGGKNFKFVKKVRQYTKYGTATTGAISNVVKGSIYVVQLSDAAASTPTIGWVSRVSFMP